MMLRLKLGCLLLVAAGSVVGQVPRLLHTDLDSGPNTGGEGNRGAYVTLYGRGFGEQRGTSTVFFGTGPAERIVSWTDERIVVQLGAAATSGAVRIQTAGGVSNSVPFTVRAGTIFFVSTRGDDTTNPGSFERPWRTIQTAVDRMAAGDIAYVMDGIVETRQNSREGSVYISRNDGLAGQPKAIVAYPGAKVRIGAVNTAGCTASGCIEGIRSGFASNYWTIAGFQLFGNNYGIVIRGKGWRVIGNEFSCPFGTGASACVEGSTVEDLKLWHNHVHDAGGRGSSALYHGVYFSTDSNNLDIGWNRVERIQGCRGIQIHSTRLDAGSGFNQYGISIHDNWIADTQCDGIVLATVDPSKGAVSVVNNVIVNAGRGPATPEGGGNFACVYVQGVTNNGTPGGGTVDITHNTMVDCGAFTSTTGRGGVMLVERNPQLKIRMRNNILWNRSAPYFGLFSAEGRLCNTTCGNLEASNNLVFGQGAPPANAAWLRMLNADPQFVSFENRDFRLRASSPARGAGTPVGVGADIDARPRTNVIDLGAYQSSGTAVTAPAPLTAAPGAFDFSMTAGGTPPEARTLTLSNAAQVSVEWTAVVDQPWLVLGSRTGIVTAGAAQGVGVSVNAEGLPPGVHRAVIRVQSGESEFTLPVTLTIAPLSTTGPALWVSTAEISLGADPGAEKVEQTVRLANFGAPNSSLRYRISVDQPWLTVSPADGTLAAAAMQTVTLTALPPARVGLFTARVTIATEPAMGDPVVVPLRLVLSAPRITAALNAGSLQTGGLLSPRAIFTIFGQDVGPETPVGARLTADGKAIAATGGEVMVFVNDVPAPILYASNTQINAIVPGGQRDTRTGVIRVEFLGRRSPNVTVPMYLTSPALFTFDGSGKGAAALLNQNGSVNTDENPAAPGSVVSLYLTGLGDVALGSTVPADGEILTSTEWRLGNATSITIGERDAQMLYIGVAPGFVAGVYQINVRIPSLPEGRHDIRVTSGGISSPDNVTIAVR